MSPTMGTMLMNDVVPRLKTAARSMAKTGADDNEVVVADMTLQAARMMVSADKVGKTFTPGKGEGAAALPLFAWRGGLPRAAWGTASLLPPGRGRKPTIRVSGHYGGWVDGQGRIST